MLVSNYCVVLTSEWTLDYDPQTDGYVDVECWDVNTVCLACLNEHYADVPSSDISINATLIPDCEHESCCCCS